MSLAILYPFIKPYALGAPDSAVDAEIVMAVKELARKTLNVRDYLYLDSQYNWGMYPLDIPEGRHLEQVTKVCIHSFELKALESKPCETCTELGYWVDANKTLYIYPSAQENEEGGIQVEYAYSPSLFSCDVDESFLEKYASDIKAGVLSNLLSMKGQRWFDPQQAQMYREMWQAAKISALTDGGSQYTRGYLRLGAASDSYLYS